MFALLLALSLFGEREMLIVELGNDEFLVREQAQIKILGTLNFDSYHNLIHRQKTQEDPEIRERINFILSEYEKRLLAKHPIDLKGYKGFPFIDVGLPQDYKWRGLTKHEIIRYYRTLAESWGVGGGAPHYPDFKKATEFWLHHRRALDAEELARCSKTPAEFHAKMMSRMKAIHDDLELLKEGDDRHWKNTCNQKNPFREK